MRTGLNTVNRYLGCPKTDLLSKRSDRYKIKTESTTLKYDIKGVIGVRQQTDGQMLRYGKWKRMGQGNTGGHAPRVPKSNGEKVKQAGIYPF